MTLIGTLWGVKVLMMTLTTNLMMDSIKKEKVTKGIEFLLSHFKTAHQQLFPRKMSTALTDGRQFTVWNHARYCMNAKKQIMLTVD